MIPFRMISLPMFALAASLVACTAEQSTNAQPDTASTAQQATQSDAPAEGAQGHGRRGPHFGPGGPGGPEFLIGAALHAPIDLTDAQRSTIEGLMKRDDVKREGFRERPAFDATKMKTLAAAVRSGDVSTLPAPPALDQTKLQAHLAQSAARLKTLHDTLSADQRAKLVADIESHAPKAGGEKPAMRNGEKPAMRGGPAMHRGPHGGPDMAFGNDLNLTDAQKEQLKTKFEANRPKIDFAAVRADMKTKLESFKADNFDATAFVTPPAQLQPKTAGNPLADLVSVLTPEQREILAKKLEAGPPAMPAPPPAPQEP